MSSPDTGGRPPLTGWEAPRTEVPGRRRWLVPLLLLAVAIVGSAGVVLVRRHRQQRTELLLQKTRQLEVLERKIEAWRGGPDPVPLSNTKIVVTLQRASKADVTRAFFGEQDLGGLTPGRESAIEAAAARWIGDRKDTRAADDLRGEVQCNDHVPTDEVIRAVDALIAAGLKDVSFRGAPPPSELDEVIRTLGK